MRNDSTSTPRVLSEMPIPKPRGEIVAAVIMAAFVLFFVVLAIINILNGVAFIASILWLALIGFIIYAGSQTEGLGGFLIDLMGAFAFKHFVERIAEDEGCERVRFGFRLLGHRFYDRGISVGKIESVEWHTGQGSHMAGRDMNDWHVGVWFDHGDADRSRDKQESRLLKPEQDVYCVGPSSKKAVTAAFGLELVAFLRQAGVDLVPGKDDSTYVRRGKEEPRTDDLSGVFEGE